MYAQEQHTKEQKHGTTNPHPERESLGSPTTIIQELGKHIRGSAMRAWWRKIGQRNQDRKESNDMEDQNKALDFRKEVTDNCVEEHSNDKTSPHEKHGLPRFRFVFGVIQDDEALQHHAC